MASVGQAWMQRVQVPQWSVRGGVGGGVEVEDEFAEEEEGAVGGVDEEGVCLPIHPRPALGGEVAFEEGAGVDVGAGDDFCVRGGRARRGAFEVAEFGFHDFVVVVRHSSAWRAIRAESLVLSAESLSRDRVGGRRGRRRGWIWPQGNFFW